MTARDRTIAHQFKQLMRARGVPVSEVVVFGSRARGTAVQDSDLDVLVVVEQLDSETRETISRCAWEAGFGPGVLVQSVVMTRDEVENSPQRSSLFIQAVREEGIRI